jgi:hypothetical protein
MKNTFDLKQIEKIDSASLLQKMYNEYDDLIYS